jgi:PIN domain nuclease of toxin-antitoxin system
MIWMQSVALPWVMGKYNSGLQCANHASHAFDSLVAVAQFAIDVSKKCDRTRRAKASRGMSLFLLAQCHKSRGIGVDVPSSF